VQRLAVEAAGAAFMEKVENAAAKFLVTGA
jgi:hypothetical protein